MNKDLLDALKRNRKVNGTYKSPLPLFSEAFKAKARGQVQPARIEFYMQHRADFTQRGGLLAAERFNDDEVVLVRMLSGLLKYAEDHGQSIANIEIMESRFLDVWATLAVKDCAEADHWYTYEKDYGQYDTALDPVSSGAEGMANE